MTKKDRIKLLKLIKDMRDEQYEAETILQSVEMQLKFNKFNK
jgi:cell fate (sporulation/competence/biofilm development) regulator YmcA (YheA/YmcA/DUF963 family)